MLRLTKIFRLHNSPKSQSPEQGEEFIILPDGDSLTSPENSGSSFSSKHIVNHRLYLNDRSALRVEDKRMTQAGICKGDYVIVRPKILPMYLYWELWNKSSKSCRKAI